MKHRRMPHTLLITILTVILVMRLTACSSEQLSESNTASRQNNSAAGSAQTDDSFSESTESPTSDSGQDILIAYFSLPLNDGVDTVARASRKESNDGTFGNVRFMANVIQKNVGGDLFSIETVQEYPRDSMDDLNSICL